MTIPFRLRHHWLHGYKGEQAQGRRDIARERAEVRQELNRRDPDRSHAGRGDEMAHLFGTLLRERLAERGVSQEGFSVVLGASPREIRRWMKGSSFPQAKYRERDPAWRRGTGSTFCDLLHEALS